MSKQKTINKQYIYLKKTTVKSYWIYYCK